MPIRNILDLLSDQVYKFYAPAITLSKLTEKNAINHVDLLSLDEEGNELSILKGCKLEKGHIKNILIETFDYKNINTYLTN